MNTPNLFANVRLSSRYASQRQPEPFEVTLQQGHFKLAEGYFWKGGPGVNYRTADLEFYAKDPVTGSFLPVSPLDNGGPDLIAQVVELALAETHSGYVAQLIDELQLALDKSKQELMRLKIKEAEVAMQVEVE